MITVDELVKKLDKKCRIGKHSSGEWFLKKILGEKFPRRSFRDLYTHYNQKFDISEETMMLALFMGGFSCKVCRNINQAVFYRACKRKYKMWAFQYGHIETPGLRGFGNREEINDEKYTAEYLDDLFDRAVGPEYTIPESAITSLQKENQSLESLLNLTIF